MKPALSTNWNAYRHADGAALIDEILGIGFETVECGWNLNSRQAEGIRRRVEEKAVTVCSVHAFAPVSPEEDTFAGPNAYSLCTGERESRSSAVYAIRSSLAFALEVGARNVVLHAGRVSMRPKTPRLIKIARQGGISSAKYRRILEKLITDRQRRAPDQVKRLEDSLDELLPCFTEAGVCLCLENLPEWESMPSEEETLDLCERFASPHFGCWHDFGHARLREQLGFAPHRIWARRLLPWCRGIHLHDSREFADTHSMPPQEGLAFERFLFFNAEGISHVLEPYPGAPEEELSAAAGYLKTIWA